MEHPYYNSFRFTLHTVSTIDCHLNKAYANLNTFYLIIFLGPFEYNTNGFKSAVYELLVFFFRHHIALIVSFDMRK